MIAQFMSQEWKKILATAIVAGFFLYFWVNGPLQQLAEAISLEEQFSEFAIPKLVGEHDPKAASEFSTIGDAETHGFGHGLMVRERDSSSTFGMVTAPEQEHDVQARAAEMREHLAKLEDGLTNIRTETSGDMAFALADNGGKLIYLESKGLIEGIRGYAGEVNVGVLIREDGTLHAVHHVASEETESYLRRIAQHGFYDQMNGLRLSGGHTVDAVSGATLTSEAIASTAAALIAHATPQPLSDHTEVDELKPFRLSAELDGLWVLHIIVIGLMFAYGFQKRWRKSKRGMLILSLLSVAYIGIFLNNSFTYVSFIHPFVGTSVSSLVGLYALFTLLGAIWGKNTYCKYVCPFGNAQRLALRITPKKMTANLPISAKWVGRIRNGIALVLIVGVLVGLRDWGNFEPFPDLFGMNLRSAWFFVALASVLITVRYPMVWCRVLCPTGSVLDALSDVVTSDFGRNSGLREKLTPFFPTRRHGDD